MTPSGTARNGHRPPLGFYSKVVVLTGALGLAFIPVAAIAFLLHGNPGIIGAAVACFTCLVAGLQGLAIAALFPSRASFPNHPSAMPVVAGILMRMGLPLAVALALVVTSHPILEGGFAYYLIAFYQVMLFVELLLIVPDTGLAAGQAHCMGQGHSIAGNE